VAGRNNSEFEKKNIKSAKTFPQFIYINFKTFKIKQNKHENTSKSCYGNPSIYLPIIILIKAEVSWCFSNIKHT